MKDKFEDNHERFCLNNELKQEKELVTLIANIIVANVLINAKENGYFVFEDHQL